MTNILLSFENSPVTFTQNAYLNATQVAKSFNKSPKDYLRLDQTKEYIAELSKRGNSLLKEDQLVIIKKGHPDSGGGTWIHPKLTIDFARWLSIPFAIWCDNQISQIMHKIIQPTLDDLIPNDKTACELESLLYRSYKKPDGVRALIYIENGKSTLARQLTASETIIDSQDLKPILAVNRQLTELSNQLNEKYNVDLHQLTDFNPKNPKTTKRQPAQPINSKPAETSGEDFYQAWVNGQLPDIPVVPVRTADIFELYRLWCQKSGICPLPLHQFVPSLKRLGARKVHIRYLDTSSTLKKCRAIMPMGYFQQPSDKTQQEWLGECVANFKAGVKKFNTKSS